MRDKQCFVSAVCSSLIRRLYIFMLLTMTGITVNAQTLSVSGTVIDTEGEPMIGANVIIKGTTTGVATDVDGKYSLKNVPADATLRISYIGYQTQEVAVKGRSVIDVTLQPEAAMLDEVVAIGYATVRRPHRQSRRCQRNHPERRARCRHQHHRPRRNINHPGIRTPLYR